MTGWSIGEWVGTNPVPTPVITTMDTLMSMQKITFHACFLGVSLCSSLSASAGGTWAGSYAADGNCYCAEPVGREIDSMIVPTPVGGQSVAQICERVGKGPTLRKVDGKFNFTVYPDAQCGHGPAASVLNKSDSCLGHLGEAGEDCQAIGPKWDLQAAYAERSDTTISNTEQGSYALGQSRYITPPAGAVASSGDASNTAQNTSVTQIVQARAESTPIESQLPDTPEQLRARQLVQLEAARERARVKAYGEGYVGTDDSVVSGATASDSGLEVILTEEQKLADAKNIEATELAATQAKAESEKALAEAAETVAQSSSVATTAELSAPISALKLPASVRASSRDFDYVEGLPVNYDFGGAGMSVSASTSSRDMLHFNLNAAVAETYQEASIGAGIYLTPASADRFTVLLNGGIEYGELEFQNSAISADLSDTGAFFGLSSRLTINHKFELQGGVRFSSLFEGDALLTGAAFYHLTPNLDLTTKAEAGDNDLLGFGIRYYY